ncbi:MAG TPA: adenylate/guanylate cyclase domain-containing protein [Terriglobales bacterium]|nr:adenylate/guanylate cyclase domain-containing protein [Terriglobales bacterium]
MQAAPAAVPARRRRRRWFTPLRIALALGIAIAAVRFGELIYLNLADARMMDFRLMQRGTIEPGPAVVIVAVDNRSIAEVGRWPWPRSLVAQLVDKIAAAQPAAIAFDMVFSEPSSVQGSALAPAKPAGISDETWNLAQQALAAQDTMLSDALQRSERAALGYFFDLDAEPQPIAATVDTYTLVHGTAGGTGEAHVSKATAIVANLPSYDSAAKANGYFNADPERDGYVRRMPMVLAFGDDDMALPLELAALRVVDPQVPTSLRFDDYGVESLRWGDRAIPVDQSGKLLINYRGPGRTFPHVAAVDLLQDRVPAEVLRHRIVVLGVTAIAVADIRVTAFDEQFPGVEIHATVIDNILEGDFLYQPTWLVLVDCAVIVALALLIGLAMKRLRGVPAAMLALSLLAAYLLISQHVFVAYGLPLSLIFPMLTIVAVYSAIAVEHYVGEEREKRRVRRALELYLSPSMASFVSEHPDQLKLGGEKREMTVLFTDIRGFTKISEKLEPEALVELLNEYLGEMTEIVFRHDGMLDKYIGDAVMALWGAPLPQPAHAASACRAALAMVGRLAELNREWQQRGWQPLAIGAGINTGQMAFGNMGSADHLSLTAMGDNVNLASRIEGLTKIYGVPVLISESTRFAAGEAIIARELDFVRVRGRQDRVRLFQVLGTAEQSEQWAWLAQQFEAGLAAYRGRDWQRAERLFREVLQRQPHDRPAELFLQRCGQLARAQLPEDWDGVLAG